jgi:oxygen-independent coproporphyrinogen-3 oxidase
MTGAKLAGLYVHIPFCLTRCGYCDFNTYAGLDHLQSPYAEALVREASLWSEEWSRVRFASLFLGGGTPTTLPIETLRSLLADLTARFEFVPDAEVTVEANPDTVHGPYLAGLLEAGVTRLSLGVQSFDPGVLAALERIHSAESARRAFAAGRRAGFTSISLDLIYGANGETLVSWEETLKQAIALEPEHLSCYALTIEPATSLGRQVAARLVPAPDPDVQADMYDAACEALRRSGYEHYEVSNWARPGHRSTHNLGYWEGRPYLGLGAGAHSYSDGVRWWNVRPPQQYLGMVAQGERPVGGSEQLDDDDLRLERLLLGLRVAEGVPAEWIASDRAAQFLEQGLLRRHNGRIVLTERGLFLASEVVASLSH